MLRTRPASSLRTLTSTRTKPRRSIRARCVAREDFALAIHASEFPEMIPEIERGCKDTKLAILSPQQHLNFKTGIGQGYLSDLESGRLPEPPETIAKLAQALDVPVEWLS